MKFSPVGFYIFINILISLFGSKNQAIAQSIQTDGTTPTQPVSCSGDCVIEGGLQQGNNLFHSFERFNVDAEATVLFQDPGVANILSRVTGNEISEIFGTLGVSNGDANLFLINPNGIIFGQDSSLDLNGSFLATTADAIRFGEQGLLNTAPNEIPLLTIDPSALSFAAGNSGTVMNRSSPPTNDPDGLATVGLQVPDGESLLLVGGDVTIDSASMTALGGRIELGGLAEAGEIELNIADEGSGRMSLNFPEQFNKANVSLINNTFINVFSSSGDGGDIAVNANNISISSGSRLVAGIIDNLITSEGQAGNIVVNATKNIEIVDGSAIANQVFPLAQAIGNAGNINIKSNSLLINNSSQIDASTLGQGNAGDIDIFLEENLTIDSDSFIRNGINEGAIGNAGDINIRANNILLDRGSQLVSNVFGRGEGGNIFLNIIDTVNIIGSGIEGDSSGIVTATELSAEGQAGDITVNTDNFHIANGGLISSQTLNQGNGGNISIDANTFTAINGGQIVTSAANSGDAGNMNIRVSDNLLLLGNDSNFEARFAEFGDFGNEAPGNSGFFANVRPEASGAGGDIDVTAGSLDIEDSAEINVSAEGTGAAGSLSIDAQDVTLDRGNITAATRVGDEGNISLNNADSLLLDNNSQITTDARESATGGDITIDSDGIALLDDSNITADAERGQGGNIQITTQGILREPNSEITAESELGIDGTVTFNTPDVDPISGIQELPDVTIDADAILAQDFCKLEDEKIAKGSSFIITGRGGLIPTSKDSLTNRDRLVDWASRDDIEVSQSGAVGIRQRKQDLDSENHLAIRQSQGLLVAKDGTTWLTANAPHTTDRNSQIAHPDCNTSNTKSDS